MSSRSYAAEPDPEFAGQAILVRVSSDPEENGQVVGWTTGPHAMASALDAAHILSQTGSQLSEETAARLGYTPKDGAFLMSTWTRPPPDGLPRRRWPRIAGAVLMAAVVLALILATAIQAGSRGSGQPGRPAPVQTFRVPPPGTPDP